MDKLAWIIIIAIPVIFAIVFHEVAHGFVAYHYGDPTAKLKGRLSLNPLVHIDPIGTIILPAILILTKAPILFGWAKPVPVNFGNLRDPRKHMAHVSAAGPATNFTLAILCLIAIKIIFLIEPDVFIIVEWLGNGSFRIVDLPPQSSFTFILKPLARMLPIALAANIALGLLNLIPILPLDGGRILTAMLPRNLAAKYSRIEPYGIFILIALLLTGGIVVISVPFEWILEMMSRISNTHLGEILFHITKALDIIFAK